MVVWRAGALGERRVQGILCMGQVHNEAFQCKLSCSLNTESREEVVVVWGGGGWEPRTGSDRSAGSHIKQVKKSCIKVCELHW